MPTTNKVVLSCGHIRGVFYPEAKIKKHESVFCSRCDCNRRVERLVREGDG